MTTREELLDTLRRLAVEQGPDITLYRFREETGISRHLVYDRWGNWTNLRVAAGLPRRVTIGPVYSEDELLGEFHAAVLEIDRYPTLGEFSRLSDRSWNTFDRRFGPKLEVIDRYRDWLEPQPAEARPPFLAGIERDCEPSGLPGVGVPREVVPPPFDLSSLLGDMLPATESEPIPFPPEWLRRFSKSFKPLLILMAVTALCAAHWTARGSPVAEFVGWAVPTNPRSRMVGTAHPTELRPQGAGAWHRWEVAVEGSSG